jgi:hypothetical protein
MPLMVPIRIARIMIVREYFAMKLKNFMLWPRVVVCGGGLCLRAETGSHSAKGAEYVSQGQALSGAKRVAPG